jgi:tetratricopeptide (TPR) repeat protein
MIRKKSGSVACLVLLSALCAAGPVSGQYREYYFYGKVIDTDKAPLEGVEIKLRDVATSRGYSVKTNKNGEFKFAGLPHGVYKVTFQKEGFAVKEDEWRFATPQESIQKVEIPDVTLVSQALVERTEQLKAMEAEIKAAADKIRARDFEGAVGQLNEYLAKHPDESNALYYIGIAYSRLKKDAEALAALSRVAELVPNFPPVYFELGVVAQRMGEKEKAIQHYLRNAELDPGIADSFYNAGLILFGLGRIEEARGVFDKALALRPDDPDVLEMAARCAINAGDFPLAIAHLEKALTIVKDEDKVKFLQDILTTLREKR